MLFFPAVVLSLLLPPVQSRAVTFTTNTVIAATNLDGDQLTDLQEYRAGTDPLNPNSRLEFNGALRSGSNGIVLEWEGVAGRLYRVNVATDLTGGFVPLVSDIPAVSGPMRFTNTPPQGVPQLFYRLEVQSP